MENIYLFLYRENLLDYLVLYPSSETCHCIVLKKSLCSFMLMKYHVKSVLFIVLFM